MLISVVTTFTTADGPPFTSKSKVIEEASDDVPLQEIGTSSECSGRRAGNQQALNIEVVSLAMMRLIIVGRHLIIESQFPFLL